MLLYKIYPGILNIAEMIKNPDQIDTVHPLRRESLLKGFKTIIKKH